MSGMFQSVRGMSDTLPPDSDAWYRIEQVMRAVITGYGYQEIRLPIVEPTELFARSIGDLTDIVQKEMYSFLDRSGDSLSLRPEGTAGCVRAVLQHGLLNQLPLRLWYQGAMFRHERPQKGRLRQFHQVGVEAFGIAGPDIDAELILMTARLWRQLGIGKVALEINSLGTAAERREYHVALQDYFRRHAADLDDDSRGRLERNPLRILDSKNPAMQDLLDAAPVLDAYLQEPSRAHQARLQTLLREAGIAFRHNPRLVRGLDYYTHTVFEWITRDLGAQGTICGGGRFDGLVEQFGGKPTPAIGFSIGIERVVALCQGQRQETITGRVDCYLMPLDAAAEVASVVLAERLRDALPGRRIVLHCGGGSLRAQLKRADRSGADIGLLLGADEHASGTVTVKYLRAERAQCTVSQAVLADLLRTELGID